jgi:tagaturonate reductase
MSDTLSRAILPALANATAVQLPPAASFDLPEKVLQFGTGVLLRGLPDFFIDQANRQGIFNGRIVVVKSTDKGDSTAFDEQDNLYTICVRGIEDGRPIEENVVCSAISRVLSAKSQWQDILTCAENPEMQLIISNTTEVGIQLVADDQVTATPPVSFPGKLLAFLQRRYQAFQGTPESGLVIVPTELITDNGTKLRDIVLELARNNNLAPDFTQWLQTHNHFCNSLVDRIVPGMPEAGTKQKLEQELGYSDNLLAVAEPYSLWAIEGNKHIKTVLTFAQADERIYIQPDINSFRELKLRLLNGTHSLSCGLAILCGFTTVKEAMQDNTFASFLQNLIMSEIAPAIPYRLDEKVVQRFGMAVADRFRNPYIEHEWLSISLNYTSKMKMRNIPLLVNYYQVFNTVPQYFALGFAAYVLFMKPVRHEGPKYYGRRGETEFVYSDEKANLFYELWQNNSPEGVVKAVLQDLSLWDQDLTLLPGFEAAVAHYLQNMLASDVYTVLQDFFPKNVHA